MPEIHYKALKSYLKDLKEDRKNKGFAHVYLIYGEELLYKTAFEELLDALMPDVNKSLNYELIGGANEYLQEAIERVNTYSLLSGTKVVAICDSEIFYSKQDEDKFLEKSKEAFDKKDIKRAAENLVSLLGLLKLSFDDVSRSNRSKTLNLNADSLSDDRWLDNVIDYCVEYSLPVPSGEDKSGLLQKTIEKGFPKGNHLIITTDMVDKRRKLFNTIRDKGMIIDCSVPKGDRRADKIAQKAVLSERMEAILEQCGKSMDESAYRAMYEMTGFDLRTFSNNLQKLVSYVGDRKKITVDDVESVLKRTKKDPIYELTNAISERNIERSLFFLDSLFKNDVHPLQILAAIINQVRRLLLVRGFLESAHGRSWHAGMQFSHFKNKVMPSIQAFDRDLFKTLDSWDLMASKDAQKYNQKAIKKGEKKKSKTVIDLIIAKNPNNPYPVYQMLLKSELFTTDELIAVLESLSQSDLQLKSTGQNPRIILEKAILSIC
jgi:DNA polymerase-3 subunit delta